MNLEDISFRFVIGWSLLIGTIIGINDKLQGEDAFLGIILFIAGYLVYAGIMDKLPPKRRK